jgi:hypothetical protein
MRKYTEGVKTINMVSVKKTETFLGILSTGNLIIYESVTTDEVMKRKYY